MSEIILDAATAATVAKAFAATRVCDPEGRTVGYLVSEDVYKHFQATMCDEPTVVEMREALADPRRHTTEGD